MDEEKKDNSQSDPKEPRIISNGKILPAEEARKIKIVAPGPESQPPPKAGLTLSKIELLASNEILKSEIELHGIPEIAKGKMIPLGVRIAEAQSAAIRDAAREGAREGIIEALGQTAQADTKNVDRVDTNEPHYIFRCNGDIWHIEFEKEKKDLSNILGLQYIHILLKNPDKNIPSIKLYRMGSKIQPEIGGLNYEDNIWDTYGDDQYPTLDAQAIKESQDRIDQLDLEINNPINKDPAEILEMKYEKETIQRELQISTFRHKGINLIKTDLERARQNISKAIDRVYKSLREEPNEMIGLMRYLSSRISRGKFFIYDHDKNIKWEL